MPLKVTCDPANVAVIDESAAKPEPVAVTEEPTSPLDGLNVIAGVTVNVAVGVLLPSVTVTV